MMTPSQAPADKTSVKAATSPTASPAISPPPPPGPTTPAAPTPQQNAHLESLERRIAALETRAAAPMPPPKAAPTWQTPTASFLGAMLSSGVALFGFWRVHRFSVLRQERDEFYKRVQDCVEVVNTTALAASVLWRETGEHATADERIADLQDGITDISQRLAFLKTVEKTYDVDALFTEFKRTATLNIEDGKRPANPLTAEASRRTGRYLTHAMQTEFYKAFPTSR